MKSQNRVISCLLIFFLFFLQDGALAQHVANDAIILHEDGSVTFQYKNPDAKSVKLYCDCELHKETTTALKEDYSSVKMNRDSNGVWSYTTPPLPPEVYTLWGSAQQTILLSCERSLFLSLYCAPLYSAITSPSNESSNIC